MRILVTGVSGFAGAALVPRLREDGHELRGFARDASRVRVDLPVVTGDAVSGEGLDEALDGIDVAYFLIHSMERGDDAFAAREARLRRSASSRPPGEPACAGSCISVGSCPPPHAASPHLSSRLAVEEALLGGVPEAVALRASIVVGADVALVPLPRAPRRAHPASSRCRPGARIAPGRSTSATSSSCSRRAATTEHAAGGLLARHRRPGRRHATPSSSTASATGSWSTARSLLLPVLPPSLSGLAAPLAAAITGEDPDLIGPLMASLESDLLPRDDRAADLLGVELHPLDRSIARALRDWESVEELGAR